MRKRIFREWQHPRDGRGRFANGGSLPRKRLSFDRTAKTDALRAKSRVGTGRSLMNAVNDAMIADLEPGQAFRRGETKYDDQRIYDLDDPRDHRLTRLVQDQGWGAAEAGTSAEVDARIRDGWIEAFRGVRPFTRFSEDGSSESASGPEQIEAMRDSRDFSYGSGIYGNGIYFSVDRGTADFFAGADHDTRGTVTRAAINPAADIVDYDYLVREQAQWFASIGPYMTPSTGELAQDLGRFATMRGYDAIVVRNKSDGHTVATQYVVLNRGAMIVEKG